MKKLFNRIRPTSQKGQGLVELAITAPILIFMLLGVFEVGWALRGYLVLTNVNREITRFAIRPGYLDYSVKDNTATAATTVGYDRVVSYTYTTLSDQLALNFSAEQTDTLTSTLIISHIVVDTAIPCEDMDDCDCNAFVTDPNYINNTDVLTYDDLILHPAIPGYEYFYAQKFPPTSTYQTQVVYTDTAMTLLRQNNKFNCELMKKNPSTIPAANNLIITEIHYRQPQLFGFPVISNPLTDPVPMYAHTAMRMIVASRSGENVDTVGPVCIALPLTIKNTQVATATEGVTIMDILGGENPPGGTDDRGFLGWDPDWDSTTQLRDELLYPRTAFNSYTNARDDADHTLSVGDWVRSARGNHGGVEPEIEAWAGRTMVIPVYDDFDSSPGEEEAWHISTFIRVRILKDPPYEIKLTGNNPEVWAIYEGIATECLQ